MCVVVGQGRGLGQRGEGLHFQQSNQNLLKIVTLELEQ